MWTKEKDHYYHLINSALLEDDHQVLDDNVQFILSLQHVIKSNSHPSHTKVYRGLELDDEKVKEEYKVGTTFLWPTFTCTSKSKEQAGQFGHYLFEIDIPGEGTTYCCDISQYSDFPQEEEMLFYPYTGFRVNQILQDEKLIKLTCVDTSTIEVENEKLIPDKVKIYDQSRNIAPQYKDSEDAVQKDNRLVSFAALLADATIVLVKGEQDKAVKDVLPIVMLAYQRSKLAETFGEELASMILGNSFRSLQNNGNDEIDNTETANYSNITSFGDFSSDVGDILGEATEGAPPEDTPNTAYGLHVMELREYIHKRVTTSSSGISGLPWKA
ncbi:unnamed protein product [Didymodactylos carnosus]|uniref:NAD(P)(+)--arginine ADP-ribosyltransferase n=1 Tax=Didymodactylos carnosus TaxID=1234261 RepID=A0A815TQ27_9BILA|nr:unnamed protein product [Didymodactylos carnosus]CAF4369096.1 unnamed protein product [Didymodactylos carnosus]